MTKFRYGPKVNRVWNRALRCHCGQADCTAKNHRLCNLCHEPILYGSHSSELTQVHSKFVWHVAYIRPPFKGGSERLINLQAVHVDCQRLNGPLTIPKVRSK